MIQRRTTTGLALGLAARSRRGRSTGARRRPRRSERRSTFRRALHGVDGKHVTILHGTFPAGWVGGRHYHTGPVFVYVLEGSFTVDEQGKPRQTFTAGQLYEEPIGTPMRAPTSPSGASVVAAAGPLSNQGQSGVRARAIRIFSSRAR